MPYIDPIGRQYIDAGRKPIGPGELNYAITQVVRQYVEKNGRGYRTFNDILGALDGSSKEFYRRVVVPYENGKLSQNGDVY